jgi:predicted nucleic acid-binding protein
MTLIFIDTGALFAYVIPDDDHHQEARQWIQQNREPLLTSDYIIDECLTLIKARGQGTRAAQLGELLFDGRLARVHYLTEEDIQAGWQVFRTYIDKDWSFTDCVSKALMEHLGITHAFAFDQHFRQFGSVIVVP